MIRILVLLVALVALQSCTKENVASYNDYVLVEDVADKAFREEVPDNLVTILLTWLNASVRAEQETDFFDASHALWLANMRLSAVYRFNGDEQSALKHFFHAQENYKKIVREHISEGIEQKCFQDWIFYEKEMGMSVWLEAFVQKHDAESWGGTGTGIGGQTDNQ